VTAESKEEKELEAKTKRIETKTTCVGMVLLLLSYNLLNLQLFAKPENEFSKICN
jgi:hypothetical protein